MPRINVQSFFINIYYAYVNSKLKVYKSVFSEQDAQFLVNEVACRFIEPFPNSLLHGWGVIKVEFRYKEIIFFLFIIAIKLRTNGAH